MRHALPEVDMAGTALKDILITTELAVLVLMREGVTERQAKHALYQWSATGVIKNHGGITRGQALWDLAELEDLRGIYFC